MKSENLWAAIVAVALLLLVGCNSFNRYEIRDDLLPTGPNLTSASVPYATDKVTIQKIDKTTNACPPFKMPELPKGPKLPYQQLSGVRHGDDAAIDAIYQKHLLELKAHNVALEKTMRKAYSEYEHSCRSYIEQHLAVQ